MDFNQKIKNKGLKQRFVANKVGVSEQFLSMCLNGKKPMPDDLTEKLTNFLIDN